ncbi:MAG TPA: Hpt domain-containing protein [Thermoanaerobaculia bacterium]|nr:Hpt domain-containing protein [Thermoanaerobaculia bacterium]
MADLELDELKREFLAEADEKIREIESKLADRSPESVERLSYLAHQLKGSGGSYGFQRISTDAAELESAVERRALGEAMDEKIRQHAANLRSEIDRRSRELSAPSRAAGG